LYQKPKDYFKIEKRIHLFFIGLAMIFMVLGEKKGIFLTAFMDFGVLCIYYWGIRKDK